MKVGVPGPDCAILAATPGAGGRFMLQVSDRNDDRVLHGGPLPRERLRATLDQLNRVILGKDAEIRLCMACLLARGHLLIEDIPGVGKTTLAHALAQTLGLTYQRIQFTSDLLPADIIGVSIFDRAGSRFEFQRGPIFAQLVLADEVNRATPKAQSALLEAMEEQQVTVDGRSHPLPEPFFVIATQNPIEQVGTFPLPESQLDRFLMRIELGYPDSGTRASAPHGAGSARPARNARRDARRLRTSKLLQAGVGKVHAAPALLDYVQALVAYTRASGDIHHGPVAARRDRPAARQPELGIARGPRRRGARGRAGRVCPRS